MKSPFAPRGSFRLAGPRNTVNLSRRKGLEWEMIQIHLLMMDVAGGFGTAGPGRNMARGDGDLVSTFSFFFFFHPRPFSENHFSITHHKLDDFAGDVVGVHLDITEGTMSFSLNGENFGNAFENFPSPPDIQEIAQEGLYPAVSLMNSEHCIFNFGHKAFRHPPEAKYRSLNSVGNLRDSEKSILPRLAQRPTSMTMVEFDDKEPLCQICYEKPPNALLVPCGHKGICFRCSLLLTKCPICRKEIEDRKILSQLFTHAPQGEISRPQSPTIKELAEMSANESETEEAEMKFSASVLSFDGPSSPKGRGKN